MRINYKLIALCILLACFADTAVAQQSVTATISADQDEYYEGNLVQGSLVGATIPFDVTLGRRLTGNEMIALNLNIRGFESGDFDSLSLVRGPNVSLGTPAVQSSTYNNIISFRQGSRTARFELKLNDNRRLNADKTIEISIAGLANDSVTVLDDEYILCFSNIGYQIREGSNGAGNVPRINLLRGEGEDNSKGLNRDVTASLTYDFSGSASRADINAINSLTIKAGQTHFLLNNLAVDDDIIERSPSFDRLTISVVQNQNEMPTNVPDNRASCRQAIIIIEDNDPTLTITAPRTVIAGNDVIIMVASNTAFTDQIVVPLRISGGGSYVDLPLPENSLFPVDVQTALVPIETEDFPGSMSSAELTAKILPDPNPAVRYSVGDPDNVTVRIVPPSAILYIRSKVFLEGPLQ